MFAKIVLHLQVYWRAVAFGLGAYAVIRLMVYLADHAGLMNWLHRPHA